MLYQTSANVTVYAFYTAGVVGKTGLTVKVAVSLNGTVISGIAVSDAVAATEVDSTNQPGLYSYTLLAAKNATEGAYTFHFYTTDTTVALQHLESLIYCFAWVGYIEAAGGTVATVANQTTINNNVLSRLPTSSYVAPDNADIAALRADYTTARAGYLDVLNGIVAAVVNGVLDVAASLHNVANSIGAKINSAASAGDPLGNNVPAGYGVGTAGYDIAAILSYVAKIVQTGNTFVSPVTTNMDTTLYPSRDYNATDGLSLDYPMPYTVFNTDTFNWNAAGSGFSLSVSGAYLDATHCRIQLTNAQLASLQQQTARFEVEVIRSGRKLEAVAGNLFIKSVIVP